MTDFGHRVLTNLDFKHQYELEHAKFVQKKF